MRPVPRFSEDARQLVHMATGGVALLLRFTSWWQAAVLAGGAVAFNTDALPHVLNTAIAAASAVLIAESIA